MWWLRLRGADDAPVDQRSVEHECRGVVAAAGFGPVLFAFTNALHSCPGQRPGGAENLLHACPFRRLFGLLDFQCI